MLRRLRHLIAINGDRFIAAIASSKRDAAEVLVSEIIPLCDAIRFLEREAPNALRPRSWGRRRLPLWLFGTRLRVYREPLGVVLVIGPQNYPLFLPGVQLLQALCAGNAVVVKPAPGCSEPVRLLAELFSRAGGPEHLLTIASEDVEAATRLLDGGIDKVLLTGSARTGREVLAALSTHLVPATLELSGVDAVFVLPDADMDLAARSMAFGLTLNHGATCIAPRRIFVTHDQAGALEQLLAAALAQATRRPISLEQRKRMSDVIRQAIDNGARPIAGWPMEDDESGPVVLTGVRPHMRVAREDVFAAVASIIPVADMQQALALNDQCPFALAATVFGSRAAATALARQVNAGVVVINDIVVPHADPRLPFAPRGQSGYGITRGLEGLLELTRVKAVSIRRGRLRPHLLPRLPEDSIMFKEYLAATHAGSASGRWTSVIRLVNYLRRRPR